MGRLIRQGAKGADVRAIQDVLNFHVRRLARAEGGWRLRAAHPRPRGRVSEVEPVKADGIVGPRTMAKLFEEEALPISFALVPQLASLGVKPRGIQPPRLIPPLTLPPLTPPLVTPFFLPPDSSSRFRC